MKVRFVASGVAVVAMGFAVPTALSGAAFAKTSSAPIVKACSPSPAFDKKTVTIEGKGLAGATSVTIAGKGTKVKVLPAAFTADSGKAIEFPVPKKIGTVKSAKVTVTTANGSGSAKCAFEKPTK